KDPLGPNQIFETILSQIAQAGARWQRVASQLLSGEREQDLAAVSGVQQPGDAVERRAAVITLLLLGGTGVQRHPHPQRTDASPRLLLEPPLRRERRRHCLRCRGEGGAAAVTHGLEDKARI